ncbi:hypothetical protein [Nocardioides sp.]|uniref:Sulfate permease n=1 Tax=metagenome TaxID=256318 RepID=A0A2P2BX99_9ZZZZ
MLFTLSVRLAATIHNLLRAAPTNRLISVLRTPRGLNWALPTSLALVPIYVFLASMATTLLESGGPGWVNLVVLTCIWNAIKFAGLALLSPCLLVRRRAFHDQMDLMSSEIFPSS